MTVQRENLDLATTEVVEEAESVLEGTPVEPVPAPPTEVPQPTKEEEPEVKPMCCGGGPGHPLLNRQLISEGEIEHDPSCENHPNNKAS